jgi:hypothetical protein
MRKAGDMNTNKTKEIRRRNGNAIAIRIFASFVFLLLNKFLEHATQ